MLADYQKLVERKVRDDTGELTPDDVLDAIDAAVARYSQDRPRSLSEDVSADGSPVLPLPAAWQAGTSQLQAVEHPVGQHPPALRDDWYTYDAPDGAQIHTRGAVPAGEAVRLTFTVMHRLDGGTDTIPLADRQAVANWGAAEACDQLASHFSGDSAPTIQADSVDHGGKAREFARRAERLRQRYYDALGMDPRRNAAAGVTVDLDQPDSRGRDRLQHPARHR